MESYLGLVGVVIGSIVAFGGSVWGSKIADRRQEKRESKQLALAFRGEIGALVDIVEARDYAENLRSVVTAMRHSKQTIVFQIPIRLEYFNVYKANVGRIGLLDDQLSEMVPIFYVQASSLLEDVAALRDGTWENGDYESVLKLYDNMVRLLERTMGIGNSIVALIGTLYSVEGIRG